MIADDPFDSTVNITAAFGSLEVDGNSITKTVKIASGALTIPSNYNVKRGDCHWESWPSEGCSSLTSVTIPDSVTSIGNFALYLCLIEVVEGNSEYTSQDGVLFNKNKTTLIVYPGGKQSGHYSIPDSVTSIGGYAFYNCSSLTSVTIPDSVTSIGWPSIG